MQQVQGELQKTQGVASTAAAGAATAGGKFASGFANAGTTLQTFGGQMQTAGRNMTLGVTLPLAAVGGAALNAAIDFESSFAGIRKTVDATEPQFAALEASVIRLSETIPVSTTELNRIGEVGGALGIPIDAMDKFIETAALLGATTELTAEDAATAIAQLSNVMGTSAGDLDRYGATLVDLGNKGASSEQQILDMAARIGGAGAVVGLSEAQVLGFAAGLANMGINAEAGGSAISRGFINMQSAVTSTTKEGRAQLETFASTAGMTADEFKVAFEQDASGAMIAFIQGLDGVIQGGGDVAAVLDAVGLNSVAARDAFLRAASGGDAFTDAINVATTAWGENSAMQDEASERFKSTESQLEIVKNQFMNTAASLGEALIPMLKELLPVVKESIVPAIRDAVTWFKNLDPSMQKSIVGGAALLAALGPITVVFGSLLKTI
jgi:TP901 family phage tail tape measure protein